MEDRHTTRLLTYTHIALRIIHAVGNVAVFQIILHLLHSHHSTVVLRLLRGRAKVRNHDAAFLPRRGGIWEIGHVFSHLARFYTLQNRLLINKKVSRKV